MRDRMRIPANSTAMAAHWSLPTLSPRKSTARRAVMTGAEEMMILLVAEVTVRIPWLKAPR
jgi:hypothetical protein